MVRHLPYTRPCQRSDQAGNHWLIRSTCFGMVTELMRMGLLQNEEFGIVMHFTDRGLNQQRMSHANFEWSCLFCFLFKSLFIYLLLCHYHCFFKRDSYKVCQNLFSLIFILGNFLFDYSFACCSLSHFFSIIMGKETSLRAKHTNK